MSDGPAVPARTGWLNLLLLRADFWRRSRAHQAGRLLLLAAYGYLTILGLLLYCEDWMLYHARPASRCWHQPPAELHALDVDLTAADGTRIHAWWCVPPDWRPEQGAVLLAHGNDGNLGTRRRALLRWQRETRMAVLAFDYPGFGLSGGRPSEAGCYAAAGAAYDWLTTTAKVSAERVLLCGGSLGGAVVVDLAHRKPCRALVLISTFASFPDVAQSHFPWLPARWLVHNQFNSLAKIAACSCPVFVAHATGDAVVPFEEGRRLFDAAPGRKQFLAMDGHPHRDFPNDAFYAALRRFLAENTALAEHRAD